MNTVVEVVAVQPITGKGTLRGIARIRIRCVAIGGIRVLQQDDGAPWIAWPQAPIRRGGSGWAAVVAVEDPALADQVNAAILAAWRSAGGGR